MTITPATPLNDAAWRVAWAMEEMRKSIHMSLPCGDMGECVFARGGGGRNCYGWQWVPVIDLAALVTAMLNRGYELNLDHEIQNCLATWILFDAQGQVIESMGHTFIEDDITDPTTAAYVAAGRALGAQERRE